jgi:excisionase family DNA binding protein
MTGLLTTREVAELLGVHPETVLKWARAGDLPSIKLPSGAVRYHPEQLEAWMRERATGRRGGLSTTTPDAARPGIVSCVPRGRTPPPAGIGIPPARLEARTVTAGWPLVLPHQQIGRILNRRADRLIVTCHVRLGGYDVQDALTLRRNERRRRAGRISELEDPTVFAIEIIHIDETALADLDLRTVRGAGYETQRDFYDDWLRRRRHIDPGQPVRVCAFAFQARERYLHQRIHRGYTENPAHAAPGEAAALSVGELAGLARDAARRLDRIRREDARRRRVRSLNVRLREAILEHDIAAEGAIRLEIRDLFQQSRLDAITIRASPPAAQTTQQSGSAGGTRLLERTAP